MDDVCKGRLPPERRPGPQPALSRSEVLTPAIFGQWQGFGSERGFYRYARRRLRPAFPRLPTRARFNRQPRRHHDALVACLQGPARLSGTPDAPCQGPDGAAVPTRDAKRRGAGWLPGVADIGWSNRQGWFEGVRLLLAVTPAGAITGSALAPAGTKDQPLAETSFALRRRPHPRGYGVGAPAAGDYLTDKGFEGRDHHRRWRQAYGAAVLCPSRRTSAQSRPKPRRRWLAGKRQIVATAFDELFHTFRLDRERPQAPDGLRARLTAKMVLHNFCLWLNAQLGRPYPAFADLVDR